MITKAQIERNRKANKRLSELVVAELEKFFNALNLANPANARDALLAFLPGLIIKYGEVSEQLALEWYETMIQASEVSSSYRPVAPPFVDPTEAILGNVRYAAGHLFTDKPEETLGPLRVAVNKQVRQPGRDVISWNTQQEGVRWARVPTGDMTCSFCLVLASRGAVFLSDRSAGSRDYGEENLYHGECVVPGTLVSGPQADVGYARHYEGEMVTLVTAAGHELSITPKHPVLTDRGWVQAGLLNEGDQLVSAVRPDRNIVGGPDVDQVPARIEDVVSALGMVDSAVRSSMPGSPEQFHGDGFDSEVNVVSRYGLLRKVGYSALIQPVAQLQLSRGTLSSPLQGQPRQSIDSLYNALGADSAAPDRVMGGSSLSGSLLGGHLCSAHLSGFAGAPVSNSVGSEPLIHYGPGNANPGRYRVDTLSREESLRDTLGFVRDADAPRKFNPPAFDGLPDSVFAFAQLGADLRNRLAGSVHLDRLVSKRVGQYSGQVHNLSTEEGWYSANSITVSNCDCEPMRFGTFDEYPPGFIPEDLYDIYDVSADAVGSRSDLKLILADVRRRFPDRVKDGVYDEDYLSRVG